MKKPQESEKPTQYAEMSPKTNRLSEYNKATVKLANVPIKTKKPDWKDKENAKPTVQQLKTQRALTPVVLDVFTQLITRHSTIFRSFEKQLRSRRTLSVFKRLWIRSMVYWTKEWIGWILGSLLRESKRRTTLLRT